MLASRYLEYLIVVISLIHYVSDIFIISMDTKSND